MNLSGAFVVPIPTNKYPQKLSEFRSGIGDCHRQHCRLCVLVCVDFVKYYYSIMYQDVDTVFFGKLQKKIRR